jgi:hypothetical protein
MTTDTLPPLNLEQLTAWHDGDGNPPPEMQDAYAFVDSVIQHAGRDAGMEYVWHGWVLRWAYLAGVRAERERCAKICEGLYTDEHANSTDQWDGGYCDGVSDCAAAIRSGRPL